MQENTNTPHEEPTTTNAVSDQPADELAPATASTPQTVASQETPPATGMAVVSEDATEPNPSAVATISNHNSPGSGEVVIDPVRKQELEIKFNSTINNPRFWAKENRYKALMDALVIPVFDDRSLQQFYIHSEDDLMAKAAKRSRDDGLPAILPTVVEVMAEAWRRYAEKTMLEEKKALTKKRKDEAKANGTRFVPVTDDDVRGIVTAHVARIREQESG